MVDFFVGIILGFFGYVILFFLMWFVVGKAIWGELFVDDHICFYAGSSALGVIVYAIVYSSLVDSAKLGAVVSAAAGVVTVMLIDKKFRREDNERFEEYFACSEKLYPDTVKNEDRGSLANRPPELIRGNGERKSDFRLGSADSPKIRRRLIEHKLSEMTVDQISGYTNSSRRATISWLARHGKSCKDYDGMSKKRRPDS